MKNLKNMPLSISLGITATIIGLVTFTLSWQFYEYWGGPMPGYDFLLFPGNMTLVYIWHPLLTEEIDLYPTLVLILIGQFIVVSSSVFIIKYLIRKCHALRCYVRTQN